LTLKVKFTDFQQISRSKFVDDAIDSLADLERLSLGLLEPLLPKDSRPTAGFVAISAPPESRVRPSCETSGHLRRGERGASRSLSPPQTGLVFLRPAGRLLLQR
jgi:hypothetical protein